ncbi:DUF7130 family rubredoxin-like protein [Halobiforma nitratireducens]|uniref:DUF7130 domain-containing protein n=1 Tax=Halobiforma nitratireducens JCM 10879 TaxID=1227454 RepID=M0M576_9EURY|nr:hypothetical protein [Halobiforma nitratireducens]EMA39505.1 hypothetical protein C446_08661 [Halobiforma nitratireducens JCM 10879]
MGESDRQLYAGVDIGQSIYDGDGNELGTVRGVDDDGFYVLAPEAKPEQTLGEARDVTGKDYVMWRCWECGEMGRIEADLPGECPDCGAPREELYYWAED